MLKELIEYTVKTLVDTPQAVIVTENRQETKDVFEIKVQEQDIGKVIGKEGQTIRALRMLVTCMTLPGKEIEITVAK
jgi:hypothetical protein